MTNTEASSNTTGDDSAPNPLALSLHEAADRALDEEERGRFVAYMKQAFETTQIASRGAVAFLLAVKAGSNEGA